MNTQKFPKSLKAEGDAEMWVEGQRCGLRQAGEGQHQPLSSPVCWVKLIDKT